MSILPFPSFLDDIKEKGLRRAVFEGVDRFVEGATAGMNIQDIREALRGEAPSRRPNPRLQPHADGFWLHMRPSYFHKDMTGVYPTFRLGWLSTYFVFFETITGIFLMVWYTPSPEVAYENMLNIMSNVPLGAFMRGLHRLGAEAMVLIVSLHMLRTFVTGSYKKPRQFTWLTGVILIFFTLLLSFTGYLLPWDQLALWAVTIGASMVEAAPPEIVGENLNLLLRGGPDIGANGLLRFYLLHVLALPAFLFIFTGVHYYKVIIHGHSLPPQKENIGEDTAKRVPLDKRVYFIPDVLTSELMWLGTTTFVLIVLTIWFFALPLESHANPQATPLGTTAPWYFLWVQGALKLGDKVFWGIIFPTIILIFLAIYPYIDLNPSRRYKDRRFALSLSMGFISMITIMSYMGLPEFGVATSADVEILQERMAPTEFAGQIRPLPYEQLPVGFYTTRQVEAEEGDQLAAVNAFNESISLDRFANVPADFPLPETLARTDRALLANRLTTDNIGIDVDVANGGAGITFRPVPQDAPELYEALHHFYELIHEEELELYNGWAAIIVSEPTGQSTVKRVDLVIVWDNVETQAGHPVLENGEPILIPQLITPLDAAGEPLTELVVNEDGVESQREVRMEVVDANGNIIPERRINAVHQFIHRDGQWFQRPGGH